MRRGLLAASVLALLACATPPAHAGNEANYLGVNRGTGVPVLLTKAQDVTANTANVSVIAAVTGKRIAVVGFHSTAVTADAAGHALNWECGSGGTVMWSGEFGVGIGAALIDRAETGGFVFRCAAGVAVLINNTSTAIVKTNVRYVLED